jgi:predicted HicB family RNase H-like nuclease
MSARRRKHPVEVPPRSKAEKVFLMPLTADLHQRLRIRAAEENVTMATLITVAIEEYLEKGGKQ